ncbi:unnamed protein product [Linum tenue]|uniref:F-box domain-containing protein n=1 Tax=Linum tenue TaxID=586396 RepID=A0AAV0J7N7_9ROSI|nr:unnamed protein product [Linum tenue]
MELISALPEECLSSILCFTSPQDACRSSAVSAEFHSVADSDTVWENFLPSDYRCTVADSVPALQFSSKKELYRKLCDSVLVDGGRKRLKLEILSGKKCYELSARDLSITWGSESMYWAWTSIPESRFSEVAVLRTMSWLEIQGKINTQMLTPNTKYGAYLVLKISDRAFGLDLMPSEVSVQVGDNEACRNTAYIRRRENIHVEAIERMMYGNRTEVLKLMVATGGEGRLPAEREDGWLEIAIGDFFSGEKSVEVKMGLKEVMGHHLKGGLIVHGIEIRPEN